MSDSDVSEDELLAVVERCCGRIDQGFGLKSFILIRVIDTQRDEVMAQLQSRYPQYDISRYKVTDIRIDGDEQAYERCMVGRVTAGLSVLTGLKPAYLSNIVEALRRTFPEMTFDIMTSNETGDKVVIVDDLKGTELYEKKAELYH